MSSFNPLCTAVAISPALACHDVAETEDCTKTSFLPDNAVAEVLPDSDSRVASILITVLSPANSSTFSSVRCVLKGNLSVLGAAEAVVLAEPGGVLWRKQTETEFSELFEAEWTMDMTSSRLPLLSFVLRLHCLEEKSTGQLSLDTLDFVAAP